MQQQSDLTEIWTKEKLDLKLAAVDNSLVSSSEQKTDKKSQGGYDYRGELRKKIDTLKGLQTSYTAAHQMWVTRGQAIQERINRIKKNRLIDKKVESDASSKPAKKVAKKQLHQSKVTTPLPEKTQHAEGNCVTEYHSNAPQSIIGFLALIFKFNSVISGYHLDYLTRYQPAVSKIETVSKMIPEKETIAGALVGLWDSGKEKLNSLVGSELDTDKKNFEAGLGEVERAISEVKKDLAFVCLCTTTHYQKIESCLDAAENILTVYETQFDLGVGVKNIDIKAKEIEKSLDTLKSRDTNILSRVGDDFYQLQSRLDELNIQYQELMPEYITSDQLWSEFNQQFAEQFIEVSGDAVPEKPFETAQNYFDALVKFDFPKSYTENFLDINNDLGNKINTTSAHVSRLEIMASRLHEDTEEKRLLLIEEDKKRFDAVCRESDRASKNYSEQDQRLRERETQLADDFKAIWEVIPKGDERHNEFKRYLGDTFHAVDEIFSEKSKYISGEKQFFEQKKDAIEGAFKDPYCNAIVRAAMIKEFNDFSKQKNPQLSHYDQQVMEKLDQTEKQLKVFNQNIVRQNILDSAKALDNHVDRSLHLLNRALARMGKWRFFCKSVVMFFEFFFPKVWLPAFVLRFKSFEERQKALEVNQNSLRIVKNNLTALHQQKNELNSSQKVCENCWDIVNGISKKIKDAVGALEAHSEASDGEEQNLINPQLNELGDVEKIVDAAKKELGKLGKLCYESIRQEVSEPTEVHNPFIPVLQPSFGGTNDHSDEAVIPATKLELKTTV